MVTTGGLEIASLEKIEEGEKAIVTKPLKGSGDENAASKRLTENCTTTLLPASSITRAVFVMATEPVELVVGLGVDTIIGAIRILRQLFRDVGRTLTNRADTEETELITFVAASVFPAWVP